MRVVGLDCATDDERIGLALGEQDAGVMRVTHVAVCSRERTAATTIAKWLSGSQRGLLAVDAPLGWPAGHEQRWQPTRRVMRWGRPRPDV